MKYDEMSKAQIAKIMEKCLNCLYAEHCCDADRTKDFYCDDFKDKNEYQKIVHAKWEFLDNDSRRCSNEKKIKIIAEEIINTFNSLSKEEQDKILKECGLERR